MINYTEWFLLREVGTAKSRPSGTFVANRSQLWGPSATFGHRDSPYTVVQQAVGAVPGAIGAEIMRQMGPEMTPTPATQIPLPLGDEGEESAYIIMYSDVVPVLDENGQEFPAYVDEEDVEELNMGSEDENSTRADFLAKKGSTKQMVYAKMKQAIRDKGDDLEVNVSAPVWSHRLLPEGGVWKVQYEAKFKKMKYLPKGPEMPRDARPSTARSYTAPIDR